MVGKPHVLVVDDDPDKLILLQFALTRAGYHVRTAEDHTLTLTVPPLSTVVYGSAGRIPRSHVAPGVTLNAPAPAAQSRGRMQVTANVQGASAMR